MALGAGLGIEDGLGDGSLVVGSSVGTGVGNVEGTRLGEGLGITEGEGVGIGVVGNAVGLGDGINVGGALNGVGSRVVGSFVGAGDGWADG
jgi:hypothetical protein